MKEQEQKREPNYAVVNKEGFTAFVTDDLEHAKRSIAEHLKVMGPEFEYHIEETNKPKSF